MLNILIRSIKHKDHRYDTMGDYYQRDGQTQIRVSAYKNWRYEMLIAIHELVEYALIKHAGITVKEIDNFDIACEKAGWSGEPGEHPRSPYRSQHLIATTVERTVAVALGVDWQKYEETNPCR